MNYFEAMGDWLSEDEKKEIKGRYKMSNYSDLKELIDILGTLVSMYECAEDSETMGEIRKITNEVIKSIKTQLS